MPQIRNRKDYIDISPDWSLQPGIFPGDTKFSRKMLMSFENSHLELSSFESTLHIGAHTDAPCHYDKNGTGLETRNLNTYMGEAQVVEVKLQRGQAIQIKDIKVEITEQRVLFKTSSFNYTKAWQEDFNFFDPETIEWLAHKGVILIGIDTPSVDAATSKELLAHKMFYKHDLAVLEGINLSDASEKAYQMIALPLPIKEVDATPVRAILMEKK